MKRTNEGKIDEKISKQIKVHNYNIYIKIDDNINFVDLNELEKITNSEEAIKYFKIIAENITRNYVLIANNKCECLLTEIEFYLNSKNHPDPTVHCHPRQLLYSEWYIHHFGKKNDDNYATAIQKVGIDLVFGNNKIYFGILLRGIYDINKKVFISGPVKVLNYLFGEKNEFKVGSKNYEEYKKKCKLIESNNAFKYNNVLYFKKNDKINNITIQFNQRKGLNIKKYPDYAKRKYNIIIKYQI